MVFMISNIAISDCVNQVLFNKKENNNITILAVMLFSNYPKGICALSLK